ncbi:exosome complex exonuclease RRP43 isoform X1 [Zea mays]|uniref:exosome complex exonuclease RRP43 isoform X1 n=1 Tax=Zea mays TaxID=4577 RepID=UPI0004DE8E7E|nr:exosome complex exonuclease RRP43 isoform X1 [Zea mays]|eukprot:XP_008647516.1 exosome complex exonuclease RRP43 isoform X1 [Zea mays]
MAAETKPAAASGVAGEMEVEAYRRLFPVAFLERHLGESVRIDARRLREARPTTVALGAVSSAHGSALARLGDTAMLASVKLEVMSPPAEHPDEGSVAVEFHMPPICSPLVRPGRPTDVAPVISKALEDVLTSSGMLNLKDLCLITGKASWLAYLDIYCLNADGSLFDAALISAVAAFTHLFRLVVKLSALLCSPLQIMEIPLVSVGDDGRLFTVGGNDGKNKFELVNREKRKLTLGAIPLSLTCALHKDEILADPTSEEESIIETYVTVVVDSSDRLVSLQKLGGAVTCMATIKECISLAKERRRSLREILLDSIKAMEVDQTE